MQMDEERYDIIIAGGGAVGLTLACALADALGPADQDRRRRSRAVRMARPCPRDARASAVSAGSQHLLAALGIWPSLADHAEAVTAVDITDASSGRCVPSHPRVL